MTHKVVVVAYDQLCTFEFGCAVELFALPRPELPVQWYDFAVCAAERGRLRATGGVALQVPHTLRLLERRQAMQRENAGLRREALLERLRKLEGGQPSAEMPSRQVQRLERQLNALQRELTELRQELRRQKSEREK